MNHQNHDNKKGHGHGLMMLLCLIPMAGILLLLPRLGLEFGSFGRLTPYAFLLICPLMHIGMMFMMRGHGKKEPEQQPVAEERRLDQL